MSESLTNQEVTRILREMREGSTDAPAELLPIVYSKLRKLAQSYLRKERENHTLQATEIVHEAYLKLVGFENINWQNRSQFFAIAATLMRRILVDYARERNAEKRGGDWQKVTLKEVVNSLKTNEIDVIALNDALEDLAKLDELQSKLVELRFFGGLTIEETAEALNISPALIFLAILFGVGATLWQANIARKQAKIASDERDRAQIAQSKAESINNFLQKMLSSAAPKEAGREVKIVEVLANAEKQARTELADKPEVLAAILTTIGISYNNLAQHSDAERILRSALEIYENLPEKNEQIAKSKCLSDLADVLLSQNRAEESESFVREAVEIGRRFQPETNRDLAINLIQLGRGILKKGDLTNSEPLLNEGLTLARETEGEKSEVTLFALSQLGIVAERKGDLARVEEIYRQIIPALRENPAAKSNLATSLANLGDTLTELGKLTEAESFITEGLNLHREIYGEENIYVAGSTAKLARLRLAQKNYPQAQAEAEKSLALIKKLLPPNAPISVLPLTVLGNSLTRQAKAQDGEKFLREALETARKANSAEWRIGIFEGYLGECLITQKRNDEAKIILTTADEKVKKTLGTENSYTLEIQKNLAASEK